MGAVQEITGGGAVSDGGGLVEPEHGGQVERVGAVGEGFVELTIDAQGFEGGGSATERSRGGSGTSPPMCWGSCLL
ncbi:hypothetical protein [Saccharopolyspora sp. ASAGF58]|uniref:hypothetical protein n=1 Tax=Saccharopolyspora sp. ASAGF58 TaxID=2719023 RepID=UPI0014400477|nr:hypothetical protein [Saccharopolyspora sp. ASAGF58]QIZ37753.1 hypothetical protein FDZ84_28155 [Saccharopolyspora sp. ASAGF58]